jgi:hypothetical protein
MAGAGFKTFVAGAVLGATDVNTYLMQQSVMVFASSTARDAAIASPAQGMIVYLTNEARTYQYTGGSWKPNTPFTVEVGTTASAPITGNAAINFTASRFSQTPMVIATVQSGNTQRTSVTCVANGTTGFQAYIWAGAVASTTATTIHWIAIQATSSAGNG